MPFIAWTVHRGHLLVVLLLVMIPLAAVVGGLVEARRVAPAASAPQAQRIDLAAGYPSFARG